MIKIKKLKKKIQVKNDKIVKKILNYSMCVCPPVLKKKKKSSLSMTCAYDTHVSILRDK